jgi:membrane protein implicated in regulation of membrane protease activity
MATVSWWIWMILGLLLMLGELLTPGGFYLIFFGVGAGIVGLIALVLPDIPPTAQTLLFVVLSVMALLFFRRPLLERMRKLSPEMPVDRIEGEMATAMEPIEPAATGKAEFRGSSWNARNVGSSPILRDHRCRVENVDGLTLLVKSL